MANIFVSFACLAHFLKIIHELPLERHSDALLTILSGMCREALRLLKESHTDKKNGLEVQYREAHIFL
jgi:hypothetical protein